MNSKKKTKNGVARGRVENLSNITKDSPSLAEGARGRVKSTPKIGIVIPIYNVAPYLRECLDSVIAQTYGNFHAVLVNDGSTDILDGESKSESLKIALEYVVKDKRFVLIDKANGGLSSARNAGIDYFSKSNSSLGMRFRTCENFGDFADSKSSLNPQNSHKYKSHTANTSIVCNDNNLKDLSLRGESQDSHKANQTKNNRHTERSEVSKTRESNEIAESMTENRINKSDSTLQHCDSSNPISSALDSSLRALHFAQNDDKITLYTNANYVNRTNLNAPDSSLRGESVDSPKQSTPNRLTSRSEVSKTRESNKIAESMIHKRINKLDSPLQHCDSYSLDSRDLDCFDFDKSKSRNDESCSPSLVEDSQMTFCAHPNHTNLTPPKIDYIVFLDSDDFWDSDLLESCIKSAQNYNALPDIIWFDWRESYESKTPPNPHSQTMLELFGYANQTQITAIEWLNRAKDRRIYQFWFSVMGLIRFEMLQKIHLRFLEGIIFEDNLFGILLFSQCESIAIMPSKLYNYRIRGGSTMTKWDSKEAPSYIKPLLAHFDYDMALQYFKSHCHLAIAIELQKFCLADTRTAKLCERAFLPSFLVEICDILTYQNDPYNLKKSFYALFSGRKMDLLYIKIIDKIIPNRLKRVRNYCFLLYFVPYLIVIRGRFKLKNLCYKFKR